VIATELFARGFERALCAVAPRNVCRLVRDSDLFEGQSYSLDAFHDACEPYFERPYDFFGSFGRLQGLREVREVSADYRQFIFASPLTSGWECNDTVPFKWFRGRCSSGTVLLLAPGWARVDQQLEEAVCRRMARSGVDMVLPTVPFHHARRPPGSTNGEYFISHNVLLTVAGFRQFVAEIRQLVRYMRQSYDHVGLIGLSSGGFQTGLASLGEAVDFLFPVMTGCELGKITWSSLLTRRIRAALEAAGLNEPALSKAWAIADMAVVGKHSRARYCKQYLTRYDGIVPLPYQQRLWEVHGRPESLVLEASHYSIIFSLKRIARDIVSVVHQRS